MIMDNLKRAAQGTLSERETVDVATHLCLERWEDDGGQQAPTNAALTISHHQAPSGQPQRPQESAARACLADDSANARDTHAGDGS
jgi:hypothetical protein